MEYLSVAKVGADTAIGKGVYTHFLDHAGGIRSDLTIIGSPKIVSVVCGGVQMRDHIWMRDMSDRKGFPNVTFHDRRRSWRLWGYGALRHGSSPS